ncbi:MAG TPA: MFS transporter [Acidobacteriota bacterium]|jgi:sugar phosphate permease
MNTHSSAERLRRGQIQVAATAFLALFSIVGLALYGLPLYYDFMVREYGWSRTQVTSGNAFSKLLVGPLFGFIAGWIVDRFGPRRLMLAGILMAGVALIGLSAMSSLWMFYFFYLFNALGYVCGGPLPCQVLLARWFDRSRGKAMGFAYLGIGIGGALVPWLSYWLTKQYGWHVSLGALGALIVAIAFPMAFFIKESPEAAGVQPERENKERAGAGHDAAAAASNPGLSTLQVESSGRPAQQPVASMKGIFNRLPFYLLAFGSMASIGAVGGANQHLKLFLSLDQRYAQAEIARIVSLVLTASIIGRLLMGWMADHFPKKYVMLLIYLIVGSAIPLLFFASTPGVMYLFAFVFGIGLGGDYMIIPLMAAELFGVRVLGRIMGVILTADGVAEALAPMLVGFIRDQTKTYSVGFAVLIGLALVGAVAVAFLPSSKVESQRSV